MAAAATFSGFIYSLPHQNKDALIASRYVGPFEFTAPLAETDETEAAFKLLTLKAPPPQSQPPQHPPPQLPQQPQQGGRLPPPAPAAPAARQPLPPLAQQAPSGRAGPAANADSDDEDDEFYGGLDVDSLVQQQRSQPLPAPSQRQAAAPPAAGTGHLQEGWRAGAQQAQQQQQQQHSQQFGQQRSQQQPAGGGGAACCHGVPYAACAHRQQHLDEITKQAGVAALQMADAEGPQLQALQQEMKRLRGLKQLLEAAPPPAHHLPGPAASGACGSQRPPQHPPQQQQQQQWGALPPPTWQQQQQQQLQQWGGSGGGVGPTPPHPGGASHGAGGGAGPAASGQVPGGGAPSYGGPPPGGYGGASRYGGGGAGSYGGPPPGGYGGGDGMYETGPRHEPWQVDEAARQDVAAVRQDATNDPKWRQENFPWSSEMRERNRDQFGNRNFRLNQLAIMNATLSGHDVFVLMPTGGGKSLCYQLPALLSRGVTIVVSPLVSLIQDQVHHLTVLGIAAACVGGSMTWEQQAQVYNSLFDSSGNGCKVLFITPEKLGASGKLQSTLDALHRRGELARVVIDEAHCVSQWGHDFRKDYTKLCHFKQRFKDVPILALTATATPRVEHDVVALLGIRQCLKFRSSFNRPNLSYEVRKKKKGCVDEIAELVVDKFTNKPNASNNRSWSVHCGIVYCLARAECERVAEELETRLNEQIFALPRGRRRVKHYHASLTAEEREAVQAEWTNGDVPIIVATIAFGMGINKADVRFVFHYSLPKSLEGYLQESGRAGRDGRPSTCILYYTYGDAAKSRHMIRQSAQENGTPEEHIRCNMESLNAMINYCEEQVECRRVLMLSHFGERSFTRDQCRATCDNCRATQGQQFAEEDLSEAAKKVVEVVRSIPGSSLSAVVDCYRGNNTVGVRKQGHDRVPTYGCGKPFCRNNGEAERLVRRMVVRGILSEETHRPDTHLAVISTLSVNEAAARALFSGQLRFTLHVPQKGGGSGAAGKGRAPRAKKAAEGSEGQGGAPQQAQRRQQAHRGGGTQRGPEDPIDLCSDDEGDGGGQDPQRVELIRRALRQLNAALRKRDSKTRGPINTAVQDKIAKKGPRTMEELTALELAGLSTHMKRQVGPHIMAAIRQADAFLQGVAQGAAQVEDFVLDEARVFAECEAAQPKRQRIEDWDDEDEDDWVEDVRPAAAAAGGAGSRPPPQKQPKVAAPPAGTAGQQQQQRPDFQAFRYSAGGGQQASGPGSGRQVPQQQRQHNQPSGWAQQQQGGWPQQQNQASGWPQQQQQQRQQGGWPRPPQGGALPAQQQQYPQPPPQQQQQPPRPSSAGPFGRPDGVGLKPGAQQQQQQQPQQQDDASPEWRVRKSGGAPKPAPRPLQSRQQPVGVQTGAINAGDAFGGGGWGAAGRR